MNIPDSSNNVGEMYWKTRYFGTPSIECRQTLFFIRMEEIDLQLTMLRIKPLESNV